jgi:hypothetical protein
MLLGYAVFGIAIVGFVTAMIGLYRILESSGTMYRGMSDMMHPTALREAQKVESQRRLSEALRAPAHRVDRLLIIVGSCVFVGVIVLVILAAGLAPTCTAQGQQWCLTRS